MTRNNDILRKCKDQITSLLFFSRQIEMRTFVFNKLRSFSRQIEVGTFVLKDRTIFFVKSKCEHLFWTIWQVFLVKSKCELLFLQFWQIFSVIKIIRLFEKCRFFRATFSPLIWTDVYFTKVNNFLTVILVHFEAIECQKSLKEAFFSPLESFIDFSRVFFVTCVIELWLLSLITNCAVGQPVPARPGYSTLCCLHWWWQSRDNNLENVETHG